MTVNDLLKDKQICICAGSGGVGKTTTAAAIAMGMAERGAKVAVLTIDPAKRLANALGLPELGNSERLIDPKRFKKHGLDMKGELWAMMLDPKRTFDELVEKHAPDERTKENILQNRIYQELSSALSGSQEYAAMEKLYELYQQKRYDLLVLDTPPTRNALDFLEAPERMRRFLDSRSLQFFLKPGALGIRAFGRGGGMMASILKRITGIDLLADLSEFFRALGGMAEGFRDRAKEVNKLLARRRTSFLLITAPEREPIEEAIFFWERLRKARLQFGGVIVNKVHHDYIKHAENVDERSAEEILVEASRLLDKSLDGTSGGATLARTVYQNFHDYQVLAERDRQNIAKLIDRLDSESIFRVAHFDEDIHDIAGLMRMNRYLFATRTEREEIFASVDG